MKITALILAAMADVSIVLWLIHAFPAVKIYVLVIVGITWMISGIIAYMILEYKYRNHVSLNIKLLSDKEKFKRMKQIIKKGQ